MYVEDGEFSILMDSSGAVFCQLYPAQDGYYRGGQIFKFIPNSSGPSTTLWAKQLLSLVEMFGRGIKWAENENVIASQNHIYTTSTFYRAYFMRINANTGDMTQYYTPAGDRGAAFGTFFVNPTVVHIFVAESISTNAKRVTRIIADPGNPANDYYDAFDIACPSSSDFEYREVFVSSQDTFIIGFYDNWGPTKAAYLMKVDLANLGTPPIYIPATQSFDWNSGEQIRLFSEKIGFIIQSYSSKFTVSDADQIAYGPNDHGVIHTLFGGPFDSCMKENTVISSIPTTIIARGSSAVAKDAYQYYQAISNFVLTLEPLNYALQTSFLANLDQTKLSEIDTQCQNFFPEVTSIQSGIASLNYLQSYSLQQEFPITPFEHHPFCDQPVLSFDYTLLAPAIPPPWLQIDLATGKIIVLPNAPGGSLSLTIKGRVASNAFGTTVYTIYSFVNNPPVLTPEPSSIELFLGENLALSFTLTDAEDIPVFQLYDENDLLQPVWIELLPLICTASPCPFQLILKPTFSEIPQIYSLVIRINDIYRSSLHPFEITLFRPIFDERFLSLQNSGPPVFVEDLIPVYVSIDEVFEYQLPGIIDPDGDQYKITINSQQVQSFGGYQGAQLSFYPKDPALVRIAPYFMAIDLTDINKYPKRSSYKLKVYVLPKKVIQKAPIMINTIQLNINETVFQKRADLNLTEESYPPRMKKSYGYFKIIKVTRDGQLKVRFFGDSMARIIAGTLEEQDLEVSIIERSKEEIPFEISYRNNKTQTITIHLYNSVPYEISPNQVIVLIFICIGHGFYLSANYQAYYL
ncbi:hypothetical protein FGO68_gene11104 [Halteria grandinella]|uniref:Uncharacterized protein n=1 Tax=Halteria grandinella TaxID=5974 RepID=A0A8J8P6G9_HALGN|nr:hypothetical protein FGO68_gene11104 [Halteria grandinella]